MTGDERRRSSALKHRVTQFSLKLKSAVAQLSARRETK